MRAMWIHGTPLSRKRKAEKIELARSRYETDREEYDKCLARPDLHDANTTEHWFTRTTLSYYEYKFAICCPDELGDAFFVGDPGARWSERRHWIENQWNKPTVRYVKTIVRILLMIARRVIGWPSTAG